MQDEYKLHQAAKDGDAAKALLDNEILSRAFATLRQAYLDQLMSTDVTQSALRDKCWMAARVVDVVKDHLTAIVGNGVVAKSDLASLEQEAERKKRYGIL